MTFRAPEGTGPEQPGHLAEGLIPGEAPHPASARRIRWLKQPGPCASTDIKPSPLLTDLVTYPQARYSPVIRKPPTIPLRI
jgi:hypothetical protein